MCAYSTTRSSHFKNGGFHLHNAVSHAPCRIENERHILWQHSWEHHGWDGGHLHIVREDEVVTWHASCHLRKWSINLEHWKGDWGSTSNKENMFWHGQVGAQRRAQIEWNAMKVVVATMGMFVVDKWPPKILSDSYSFSVIALPIWARDCLVLKFHLWT